MCGWRKLCLAEAGWGNFRRGRGKVLFSSTRARHSHGWGRHIFLEWTVMILLKSRINEGTERRRATTRSAPEPVISYYAALRGNVFWVLFLRRTRHDTPRPWANQQKATFIPHTFRSCSLSSSSFMSDALLAWDTRE